MVREAGQTMRLGLVSMLAAAAAAAFIALAAQEISMTRRYAGNTLAALQTRIDAGIGGDRARSSDAARAATAAEAEDRLARVNAALAEGDASRAIYEWREAYGAALRSRRWEALAAAGDAGMRIDALLGGSGRYRPEARQAYLAALLRARADGSAAGMRRVADAFAALGDEAAAIQARLMAQRAS